MRASREKTQDQGQEAPKTGPWHFLARFLVSNQRATSRFLSEFFTTPRPLHQTLSC